MQWSESADDELTVVVRNPLSSARGIGDERGVLPVSAHVFARAAKGLPIVVARVARLLIAAWWQAELHSGGACGHGRSAGSDPLPWLRHATSRIALWTSRIATSRIPLRSHSRMMVMMMMAASRTVSARTVPEVRRLRHLREVLSGPLAERALARLVK